MLINNNGPDLARFGILGLDNALGPPIDPAVSLSGWQQQVMLNGVVPLVQNGPAAASHRGNFGVALEPIAASSFGAHGRRRHGARANLPRSEPHGGHVGRRQKRRHYAAHAQPGRLQDRLDADAPGRPANGLGADPAGQQEGPLYAEARASDQDGTHPLGQTRNYSLSQPAGTIGIVGPSNFLPTPVVVPVMNQTYSIPASTDLRNTVSVIQGLYGQYQLVGGIGNSGLIRGVLQGALGNGGSATAVDVAGNDYTVHEALGLGTSGPIPAGKGVWFGVQHANRPLRSRLGSLLARVPTLDRALRQGKRCQLPIVIPSAGAAV